MKPVRLAVTSEKMIHIRTIDFIMAVLVLVRFDTCGDKRLFFVGRAAPRVEIFIRRLAGIVVVVVAPCVAEGFP